MNTWRVYGNVWGIKTQKRAVVATVTAERLFMPAGVLSFEVDGTPVRVFAWHEWTDVELVKEEDQ